MNTDFKNGKELLEFCEKEKISISRAMLLRESDQTEKTESSIYTRWKLLEYYERGALSPILPRNHRRLTDENKTAESAFKAEKYLRIQQSAGELPMPWLYWRSMPPWV